jgi:hypothetical protein
VAVVVWFSWFNLLAIIKINSISYLLLTNLSEILNTFVPFLKCTYEHNSPLPSSPALGNEVLRHLQENVNSITVLLLF